MVKFNSGAFFALTVCFAFAAATTATANPQPQEAQGVQARVQVETQSTQAYSPTAGAGGYYHSRGLYDDGIHHHHNLRSNKGQERGIDSAQAQAHMSNKSSSSDDGNCEEPEVYCGMTVPAGKTLKLKHDLYCTCTKDSAHGGDEAVAITLGPGAKLECNGYSVVQVNDDFQVGKATRVKYYGEPWDHFKSPCASAPGFPTSAVNGECGLSWGRTGIKLESGATAEHCMATGWVHGFSMVARTDDQEKIQNTIVGCDASLNTYGVGIDFVDAPGPLYFLNFSIEQSSFNNNYAGLYSFQHRIVSKIYFKDVKFNSNAGLAGLGLYLSERSEVTMENVEASRNMGVNPIDGSTGNGAFFQFGTLVPEPEAEDHVARVIFKGKNSFNNNAGTGLDTTMFGVSEIVVSKKSQLNVDENSFNGLWLKPFEEGLTTKFLVEKGGAVNACGNLPGATYLGYFYELYDIASESGVEWIGHHFTCDREDYGPDCIPCPSCD